MLHQNMFDNSRESIPSLDVASKHDNWCVYSLSVCSKSSINDGYVYSLSVCSMSSIDNGYVYSLFLLSKSSIDDGYVYSLFELSKSNIDDTSFYSLTQLSKSAYMIAAQQVIAISGSSPVNAHVFKKHNQHRFVLLIKWRISNISSRILITFFSIMEPILI